MNPYKPISTRINQNQPESTRINPNQPESTRFNPYQTVSTCNNMYQPVSTRINQNQPESNGINPYQPVSASQHPQVPACLYSRRNYGFFFYENPVKYQFYNNFQKSSIYAHTRTCPHAASVPEHIYKIMPVPRWHDMTKTTGQSA